MKNKEFLINLSVDGKNISSFNCVNEEIPSLFTHLLKKFLLKSLIMHATRTPSGTKKKLSKRAMVA